MKWDGAKCNSNSNGKQEVSKKEFKVFGGSCDLKITSNKNDSTIKFAAL